MIYNPPTRTENCHINYSLLIVPNALPEPIKQDLRSIGTMSNQSRWLVYLSDRTYATGTVRSLSNSIYVLYKSGLPRGNC